MALLKNSRFILGDQTTRKTLESTYVAGNVSSAIDIRNAVQLSLEVEYTMGAAETANTTELIVEFADMVNGQRSNVPATASWYREVTESVSAGVVTLALAERTFAAVSAAATYDRFIVEIPGGHDFMRVSIKETGVASNKGSASVKLVTTEQESIN